LVFKLQKDKTPSTSRKGKNWGNASKKERKKRPDTLKTEREREKRRSDGQCERIAKEKEKKDKEIVVSSGRGNTTCSSKIT